jgi:hypothetical protein
VVLRTCRGLLAFGAQEGSPMSRRVKSHPRASQAEMSQRTLREFEEAQRRREQQATRGLLEQAARRQGWTIKGEQ